jgi:hypothetical protein
MVPSATTVATATASTRNERATYICEIPLDRASLRSPGGAPALPVGRPGSLPDEATPARFISESDESDPRPHESPGTRGGQERRDQYQPWLCLKPQAPHGDP